MPVNAVSEAKLMEIVIELLREANVRLPKQIGSVIFGFIMGLTIILIKITSVENFGVPYTSPVAPFKFKDIKNFISSNIVAVKERPDILNTKDDKRQE